MTTVCRPPTAIFHSGFAAFMLAATMAAVIGAPL